MFYRPLLIQISKSIFKSLFKVFKAFKNLFSIIIPDSFFVFQVVPKSRFKLCKYITFKVIFSKNDLIIVYAKLIVVVLKVGPVLGEESLKGSLISLIRSRLIYLIGLSLLSNIEEINFLLKRSNLRYYILRVIITSARGGWSLRCYYIFILFNQQVTQLF